VATDDWILDPTRVPVLVVEDNLADAFAVQRLFVGTRYQPILANSIPVAKRAFERVMPAAVLLDVVLLGDESWRMILGPRQDDATGNLPIIVTSSTGEERKAIHLGADAYLQKPTDPARLLDCLDQLTGTVQ
jgi:DNA-binding response OmpR family regulator